MSGAATGLTGARRERRVAQRRDPDSGEGGEEMPGRKESEQERRDQLLRAAFEVASREGVGGLTVRAIAAEAGLSHGLVHFHFKTKDGLISALLGWVLAETLSTASLEPDGRAGPPLDQLRALLEREMARLSREPRRMRLFFEYWAMGTHDAAIRERISGEMESYRAAIRRVTTEVLRSDPATFSDVTADGLAAIAVSFINGCAVQAMIDPQHFDLDEYLAAMRAMLGQFAASPG
jgi:TetR/AcrR family transcriptional regulator, transcriptional repressor of bet genes